MEPFFLDFQTSPIENTRGFTMSESVLQRLEELKESLHYHAVRYYVEDNP